MVKAVFLLFLVAFAAAASAASVTPRPVVRVTPSVIHTAEGYTTVLECDDICPRHPTTTCRLDCRTYHIVRGWQDCINHFYDAQGNPVYHCWE